MKIDMTKNSVTNNNFILERTRQFFVLICLAYWLRVRHCNVSHLDKHAHHKTLHYGICNVVVRYGRSFNWLPYPIPHHLLALHPAPPDRVSCLADGHRVQDTARGELRQQILVTRHT